MRFIRSRPGLVVWCSIALIIAVVPFWRLRAVRQLQSPVVITKNEAGAYKPYLEHPSGSLGLSPAKSRQARQRFPRQIEAQLANFDVEKVKHEVKAIQGPFNPYYNTPQQLVEISRRLLEVRPRVWQATDDYFARYDELERQFPNSLSVRAQHLRELMAGDMGIDEGSAPAQADAAQREFYAGALRTDPWISPRQRESAIASARIAAELAPDNAFFPWMEALLQFSSARPLDALRALEAAGKCSTFDDYVLQGIAARQALLKRLQPTGWEDDFTEWALAGFPHLAKMRSGGRAAVGQMRLARRRGEPELDFRWATGLARASYAVASADENSLIGSLVGTALCAITLRGAIEDEPGAPLKPMSPDGLGPMKSDEQRKAELQKYYDDNVAFFAQLARRKGDESLAIETQKVAGNLDARELSVWSDTSPRSVMAHLRTLASAYWLNAQLLVLTLGSAVIWCAFWAITRRRSDVAPARKKMLPLAMFGAGVTGALLVGARTVSPALQSFLDIVSYRAEPPELAPALAVLRDYWPLLIALLWVALIFGGAVVESARVATTRSQPEHKKSSDKLRVAGWAVFIVSLLAALGYSVQTLPSRFNVDWLIYVFLAITAFVSVALSFVGIQRTQGRARFFVMGMVAALWITVAMIVLTFVVEQEASFYGQIALVSSFALLASGLGLLFQSQKFIHELAARTRIAAGVLALLCAVAYFGITLWSVPVEAKTRAMLARQLQIGEVAWLREQLK